MAGVAIAETINEQTGLEARLKWPNDVFIGRGKVAGIIVESVWAEREKKYTILGLGVNINNFIPVALRNATSLKERLGKFVDIETVLRKFLEKLDKWIYIMDLDTNSVLSKWRSLSRTLYKLVEVIDSNGEHEIGFAIDIDTDGALLLDVGGKVKKIYSATLVDAIVKF
jgi:BirA family biotin operon repressor/biotin-[acetyl-CoA-carboxylase] ligase